MLIIQKVNLIWQKADRGQTASRSRQFFKPACSIDTLPEYSDKEAVLNSLSFYQLGARILNAADYCEHSWRQTSAQRFMTEEEVQRRIFEAKNKIKSDQLRTFTSVQNLKVPNLSVCKRDSEFEISFYYDERNDGMPYRRGHNKAYHSIASPFYGKDILYETAFLLKPGQYGRITYNERRRAYETGEWYYELHFINVCPIDGNKPDRNIFILKEPDLEYEQLADLY